MGDVNSLLVTVLIIIAIIVGVVWLVRNFR